MKYRRRMLRDNVVCNGVYDGRSIGESDGGRKLVPVIGPSIASYRSRGLGFCDDDVERIYGLTLCEIVIPESDHGTLGGRDRCRPCMSVCDLGNKAG